MSETNCANQKVVQSVDAMKETSLPTGLKLIKFKSHHNQMSGHLSKKKNQYKKKVN